MKKELKSLLIGKKIARGRDRIVYECEFDDQFVVKIDTSQRFANVIEFDIWDNLYSSMSEIMHFFAPCHSISKNGKILIQRKTIPIEEEFELEIPKFLWDNRLCNWGMLDGRPVMHDYSNHTLYQNVDFSLVKTLIR